MKRFIILLFLLASNLAHASWSHVVTSEDGDNDYVDYSTIRYSNGFKYFKTLRESSDGKVYATGRWVDCGYPESYRKVQIVEITGYSNGLPGEVLKIDNRPFEYVKAGSVTESVTNKVCGYNISNAVATTNFAPFQQYDSGYSGGCAENGSCYGDISSRTGRAKTVHVNGYYRSNGTYVRGHYRSSPGSKRSR